MKAGKLLGLLSVVSMFVAIAARAPAQSDTHQSILIFPKVIADGTRDTLVQIVNTSNSWVWVYCMYVDGQLTFPDQPPGPSNPSLCTQMDFSLTLERQQPTHWMASRGRPLDDDPSCSSEQARCEGAGIDPGEVRPVTEGFRGYLLCVETDASGSSSSGNHLIGEATLLGIESTTASKYNAIGLRSTEDNNSDGVLCLGGKTPSEQCPNGAEYEGCPQSWRLSHSPDGTGEPTFPSGTSSDTVVTLVPCTLDFKSGPASQVTVQFTLTNEFEQQFSVSTSIACWASTSLAEINPVFTRSFMDSDFIQTTMRASSSSSSRFIAVAETAAVGADTGTWVSTVAQELHRNRVDTSGDIIILPDLRP
jgi:hypothetical protein